MRRRRAPARAAHVAAARSRTGAGADRGARLRRLPHRSASRRRRAAGSEGAGDPRPRDRRHRRRARARRHRVPRVGTRVGVPWLGRELRALPLLRDRAARISARTRASPAISSTAAMPSTRSPTRRYVFPLPDALRRRARGAAAVRRADRLPRLRDGRRGAARSASTASARRRTSSRRSRSRRGARCSRSRGPATATRRRSRRRLGVHWAGDSDAAPPAPLDAALIFAPVGALVPAALAATARGRHGRLRRHPHERHPGVPLSAAVGRAQRALGREPDAPRRRGVPGAGGDDAAGGARRTLPARARQRRARRGCAPAPWPAPRC